MIETLEPRTPAAIASFGVEMPASATVGDEITATITAQDHDPSRYGMRSVSLLATWDAALLQLVDSHVTDDLPLWRTNAAEPGRVELGATAWLSGGVGRAIGNVDAEPFATLTFLVIGVGAATVEIEQGSDPNITVPAMVLQDDHIDFASATILVDVCRAADWEQYT